MKNIKGFTLVELLAAVIILGLLTVFSIPLITRLMDKSRERMYIDDAKKLAAQAEYRLKKGDLDLENGECAVFKLSSMGNSILDTGPNGGVYDTNGSFVVAKAIEVTTTPSQGESEVYIKYEYSVRLVEVLKNNGGYKGIDLKKVKNLSYDSASSLVKALNSASVNISSSINSSPDLGSSYCSSLVEG